MPALERLFARCFSLTETLARAFHNLEGLLPIYVPVDAWSSPHVLAVHNKIEVRGELVGGLPLPAHLPQDRSRATEDTHRS